jgi:hypothetical protein
LATRVCVAQLLEVVNEKSDKSQLAGVGRNVNGISLQVITSDRRLAMAHQSEKAVHCTEVGRHPNEIRVVVQFTVAEGGWAEGCAEEVANLVAEVAAKDVKKFHP